MRPHRIAYVVVLVIAFALGQNASAQSPAVKAVFSKDSITIGDQFTLDVEIDKDLMQVVEFPTFDKGYLADSIEIIRESGIDTVKSEGRRMLLKKSYTLTCFEEGNYVSGKFPALYIDKNIVDTIWSRDSLRILVHTVPVDTLTQQIFDIKQPISTPLRFGEISGYLLYGTLAAILLGVAIFYILRYLKRRKVGYVPSSKQEAPHTMAIKQLERIHAQKLWQSGRHKQYYTAITDVLRAYLEARFGINAMDMTSEEIRSVINRQPLQQEAIGKLNEVLKTADFVKFAKYIPDSDQNEAAYTAAYYFVEETKPTDEPLPDAETKMVLENPIKQEQK